MVLKWMERRSERQQKGMKRSPTKFFQLGGKYIYATFKWACEDSSFLIDFASYRKTIFYRIVLYRFLRARLGSPHGSLLGSNEHTCKHTRGPFRCRINVEKHNEDCARKMQKKSPRPNMYLLNLHPTDLPSRCVQFWAFASKVFSKRPGAKAKWPQSGLRRKPLLSGKYLVVKKTNSKRIKASTQTKTTLCCDLANWRRWSNNEKKAVSRVRETLSAIPSDLVAVRNT